jgi:ATP-dependent Clp protease ATP-binding subunit ClpC
MREHMRPGPFHRPPTPPSPPSGARTARAATDLGALRREAEGLAKERGERPTTTHVLCALASREGLPSELLGERRITRDTVIKALRVVVEDEAPEAAVDRLFARAREVAERTRRASPTAGEAEGTHVLLAICVERTSAAHRALNQLGVDLGRLRGVLTQHITGAIEPRRTQRPLEAPERASGVQPAARATTLRPLPSRPAPSKPPAVVDTPKTESIAPPAPEPVVEPEVEAPIARSLLKPPRNVRRTKEAPRKAPSEPTRFDLDPRAAPTLAAMGINLTAAAARGELDPVVGRDAEIDRALDVLAKRNANNPCLVGAPGVGKTSIAHGVARRIAAAGGDVLGLDDRIVIEIPIGELLAGTGVRGALAERLGSIRKEVAAARGRIVVFLDEIHALLGGDAGDEAANELKTALSRGELPCIGATTMAEYRRTIERDAALARRFTVVDVPELEESAAKAVVDAASKVLESHHGVSFDHAAKEGAVAWTVRYVPSRALPDKAIAALDLAGARARRNGRSTVTRESLAEVVSEMGDVPVARLLERDGDRFLELETHLSARVVGHRDAIARIARALRRGAAGLRGNRPLFSSLLLGPTGVGKTETAKAIAEVLFHDASAMTRIDLSEYGEAHTVARLLGAPPGYVGHEDGGQLTEAVRRRPYQVVLFDEMEKAHRDVLEALLQLLDEGRMTDGRGRTVDFTNTVVILTSNLGADVMQEKPSRRLGFGADDAASTEARAKLEDRVVAAARAALPPELYNRFDEVIFFQALCREDAVTIASMALARLGDELRTRRGLSLQVDREAVELLLDQGGFDPSLGGRPIRREIARRVEAPLAELLLRGDAKPGDVVWITAEDGRVVVDLVETGVRGAAE